MCGHARQFAEQVHFSSAQCTDVVQQRLLLRKVCKPLFEPLVRGTDVESHHIELFDGILLGTFAQPLALPDTFAEGLAQLLGIFRHALLQVGSDVGFSKRTRQLIPEVFVEETVDGIFACRGEGGCCFFVKEYSIFLHGRGQRRFPFLYAFFLPI